ncbi:hypothetical protein F5X96DRAFT_613808, partial [Biscogniauxia mediterranea]
MFIMYFLLLTLLKAHVKLTHLGHGRNPSRGIYYRRETLLLNQAPRNRKHEGSKSLADLKIRLFTWVGKSSLPKMKELMKKKGKKRQSQAM